MVDLLLIFLSLSSFSLDSLSIVVQLILAFSAIARNAAAIITRLFSNRTSSDNVSSLLFSVSRTVKIANGAQLNESPRSIVHNRMPWCLSEGAAHTRDYCTYPCSKNRQKKQRDFQKRRLWFVSLIRKRPHSCSVTDFTSVLESENDFRYC